MISHFNNNADVHLLQITDCHIHNERGRLLSGVDTYDSLAQVIDGVLTQQPAAALALITGDLTHEGDERAYRLLLEQLDRLPMPFFWLPGNHDHLAPMASTANHERLHCKQITTPHWQILLLDTHIEGEVSGLISQSELSWLATALLEHPDKYAAIFMHHPLLPVGCDWLDPQRIANAEQVMTLLDSSAQVRLVCNGHVHQEYSLRRMHYQFLSTPSTCIQFKQNSADYAEDDLPPGYRRFVLHADGSFDTEVVRVGQLVRVPGAPRGYDGFN
ncbi:MAG: 3',5'-cyclic-AMP phosphodiesterase [Pseudomonadales bacterium]|nr:3',5'-cyclic-AMP phosphodiesterase [Pseudomonadales bacterium]